MKHWDDDSLQDFLDNKQGENTTKPENLDDASKENLRQYEKLYNVLKKQPAINLSASFTSSVLMRIEKGEQKVWSTIWSILLVLAGLIAMSAVSFLVTASYINMSELGTFLYKNVIPTSFKNILTELKLNFNFLLLGFGIASFLTIVMLDRWLKPLHNFKAS